MQPDCSTPSKARDSAKLNLPANWEAFGNWRRDTRRWRSRPFSGNPGGCRASMGSNRLRRGDGRETPDLGAACAPGK